MSESPLRWPIAGRWTKIGLIALASAGLMFAAFGRGPAATHAAEQPTTQKAERPRTPDAALSKLLRGNRRFVSDQSKHPNVTAKRRTEVAKGQHPFAIVLTCADSRVSPELLFDAGLGDLFVLRVAGNVTDDAILGSIEYAVEHLHAPLIMVLGHERCGAVSATVDAVKSGGEVPRHIDSLVKALRPAVDRVKADGGDVVDHAVSANAELVAEALRKSGPVLAEHVEEGALKVVAARYDLDSGEVQVLGNSTVAEAGH